MATVAAPWLTKHAGPLAIAQARKPRPVEEDVISDAGREPTVQRSQSVNAAPKTKKRVGRGTPHSKQIIDAVANGRTTPRPVGGSETGRISPRIPNVQREISSTASSPALGSAPSRPSTANAKSPKSHATSAPQKIQTQALRIEALDPSVSSSSLPETASRTPSESKLPSPPHSAGLQTPGRTERRPRRHTHASRAAMTPATMSKDQKIRMLRSNYFRSELAFLTALEGISNRLVAVPKPARLSALRAELGLIAQDLPAEVDIPVICPATLVDGMPNKSKHHRIVRLNPAEATSLNSAERVPYLLMVEILREDFDFDPDSEQNTILLNKILAEQGPMRRRLFDISDANRMRAEQQEMLNQADSVMEPASGDLGNAPLVSIGPYDASDETLKAQNAGTNPPTAIGQGRPIPNRTSSGQFSTTRSSLTVQSTPRSSSNVDLSRTGSPSGRRSLASGGPKATSFTDQTDVSALATHMRTAAQMLAQLEQSSSKRPKHEVAAIKAKIIASMQSLEEQSFLMDDPVSNPSGPTFDTIMAKDNATESGTVSPSTFNIDVEDETVINSAAGEARMENDQITGGVRRLAVGDRDDPSAATFGEDWVAKKERIRRSSPYGWMKNWDLVSMIIKTGADLRQEAFACQLIRTCQKTWETAKVPVWVKDMRILVTGESSGLIETITNGVSLHSLKRSLTLASIAAGTNPKKRIATLKDHFIKTFGAPETDAFNSAVEAFAASLAAYSIISYVLQLKDRHNGNILLDNLGHLIHIDFGFMFSNSPGSMGFEAAPFKLTYEYIEILGGMTDSPAWENYKKLCKKAFLALRKEAEKLLSLVEIMGRQSAFPCFANAAGQQAVNALRSRFVLHLNKEETESFVDELIAKSAGSYYTRL
jgi:hypothetical protein